MLPNQNMASHLPVDFQIHTAFVKCFILFEFIPLHLPIPNLSSYADIATIRKATLDYNVAKQTGWKKTFEICRVLALGYSPKHSCVHYDCTGGSSILNLAHLGSSFVCINIYFRRI